MAARISESFILRTYPLKEADLIVSFFTRDAGRLRGVARRARKPGNPFGGGLQRLSYVRMRYFHRENRELDSLDSTEIIQSPFGAAASYETGVALDYIAELSESLLPPAEPNERFFRLLIAVTGYLGQSGPGGVWPAVNYFTLWSVRLSGFLPPMELPEEDRAIAEQMLVTPVGALPPREWSRLTARGLRLRLLGLIEDHVERRLMTPRYLESL